jgi:hypothetical protein
MVVIKGELEAKEGGERVINTPEGPVHFKMGSLDYFLYRGKWTNSKGATADTSVEMEEASRDQSKRVSSESKASYSPVSKPSP